jgi:hypothetical protein
VVEGNTKIQKVEYEAIMEQLDTKDATCEHRGLETGMQSFAVDLIEWKDENGITDSAVDALLTMMKEQLKLTTHPSTVDQAIL